MKHTLIAVALMSSFSVANATNNDFVGMGAYQEDQARQDAAIHQVHMNTLTKYSESWGLEDRANIAKLQETKLDKSMFIADQQRQDKALSDVMTNQSATDAKQTTDLKSYADKKATSAYITSVAHTDAKVARADSDRKAGDDALSSRIDNNQANQSDRDNGQDTHINAVQGAAQIANDRVGNVEVRSDVLENGLRETNEQIKVTDSRSINNAVRIDSVEQSNVQRAKQLDFAISEQKAEQQKANKIVAGHTQQLADHEQRLTSLEANTTTKFADIDKRIDKVRDKADAGISGVAAMASIPQVTEYQSFAVGAGVGNRSGQSAVAVGFSARVSSSVVTKVNVAADTQSGFTVGAGLSYGW